VVFCIGAQATSCNEYGFHITAFPEWLLNFKSASGHCRLDSVLLDRMEGTRCPVTRRRAANVNLCGVRGRPSYRGVALSRSHLPDPDTYWTSLSDAGTLGVDRTDCATEWQDDRPGSCNPSCVGMSNPTWFGCSTRRGNPALAFAGTGAQSSQGGPVCATSRVRSRHL